MRCVQKGLAAAGIGMAVNIVLAIIKIVAGVLGNSYALIADGIESTTDIVSSLVVGQGSNHRQADCSAALRTFIRMMVPWSG